jgi:hypothetical protein
LLLDNDILTVQGDAIVEFGLVREIVFLFGRSWPPTLVQANGFRACGPWRPYCTTPLWHPLQNMSSSRRVPGDSIFSIF